MILTGDCAVIMATLDPDSIDAVVADPPYGIGFMGHEWDGFSPAAIAAATADHLPIDHKLQSGRSGSMHAGLYDVTATGNQRFQSWCEAWAREMIRVVKPGGHALVFGGTRTYHRLVAGLEDAGWEVRDCLVWGYASGFPKSLDVGKAIDKAAGAMREVIGQRGHAPSPGAMFAPGEYAGEDTLDRTAPATSEAAEWDGWGTALKPAWEPIVLVRKPFKGTVAGNVLTHGTGALNIDGTRIPFDSDDDREDVEMMGGYGKAGYVPPEGVAYSGSVDQSLTAHRPDVVAHDLGRWPANVVLTDPIFDGEFPGEVVGGGYQSGGGNPARMLTDGDRVTYRPWVRDGPQDTGKVPVDTEGAYSRFFLIPKSGRAEREPVLPILPERTPPGWSSGDQAPGTFQSQPTPARQNVHPTVKPLDLIRHLVRLVTPPGGVVLDPFLGSGTTALAAEMEGFGWVGIEREPEYVAIAEARLLHHPRGLGLDVGGPAPARKTSRSHWPARRGPHKSEGWGFASGQEGLLERTEAEDPT